MIGRGEELAVELANEGDRSKRPEGRGNSFVRVESMTLNASGPAFEIRAYVAALSSASI